MQAFGQVAGFPRIILFLPHTTGSHASFLIIIVFSSRCLPCEIIPFLPTLRFPMPHSLLLLFSAPGASLAR